MTYIVTALKSEARPIIDFFNLTRDDDEIFEIYTNDNISLIISGLGDINSAIATTYISHDDRILNIGICGSTYQNHNIGEIYQIDKIIDFASTKVLHHKNQKNYFNKAAITCCKTPQNDPKKFKNTLIDMESFGFFTAAKKFTKSENIVLFKVISDTISDTILTPKEVYKLIFPHLQSIKEKLF